MRPRTVTPARVPRSEQPVKRLVAHSPPVSILQQMRSIEQQPALPRRRKTLRHKCRDSPQPGSKPKASNPQRSWLIKTANRDVKAKTAILGGLFFYQTMAVIRTSSKHQARTCLLKYWMSTTVFASTISPAVIIAAASCKGISSTSISSPSFLSPPPSDTLSDGDRCK